MAEMAKKPQIEAAEVEIPEDSLKLTVARLYGRGFTRAQIVNALWLELTPHSVAKTLDLRKNRARSKLRRWEMSQEFRDMVYQHSVVDLDMSTPRILQGLSRKAQRGQVDAARLVLELTGRHSTKDTAVVPNIAIVLDPTVARPPPSRNADIEADDPRHDLVRSTRGIPRPKRVDEA
jgi:hypothetical protein